jgi:potassium-transporting ATPase ATP-binding subunit
MNLISDKLLRRQARHASLFEPKLIRAAIQSAVLMLNPLKMMRNPVMFVTEMGAFLTSIELVKEIVSQNQHVYYTLSIMLILWITVLFATFAEALAEVRGKAQADTLKKTRRNTPAKRLRNNIIEVVMSADLKYDDIIQVLAGEVIPADGEIIEGAAMVDESAITGESAPVLREAGGDRSSVTGGTKILSDKLLIRILAVPGDSFLDRMIALVEGAVRQKTPNEIALTVTLAGLTLAFLIVVSTLQPISRFFSIDLPIPIMVALFVCLIPTTIGALLAAIGLAGMDQALSANILAKSGKAVELAGDIDTLLLDKTGTITLGNRQASDFMPLPGIDKSELIETAVLASLGDSTPEGKSIIKLGKKNIVGDIIEPLDSVIIAFSAQTRISGLNLKDGTKCRKGASDAVTSFVREQGGTIPATINEAVNLIARKGSTPLVVAKDAFVLGVIALSDTLKPGIKERFAHLKRMGIRVIMVTGDNPLTAEAITHEAGIDGYIAEAKPEDKLAFIRDEQKKGHLVAMMGDGTNDAPALAQADIGVAMNSGTQAAKEASNMVDLDSDPTKLIEVVEIGKKLLMTRGALTTFSIVNDLAKYFAIIPAMFMVSIPQLRALNLMHLKTPQSAILSALIFNAIIIPCLIPLAIKGVRYRPQGADAMLTKNLVIYGLGGVITPFIGIKLIDMILSILI